MNAQQLIEAYARVKKAHALPPMTTMRLAVEPLPDLKDPATVWGRIAELAPDSGWLCFQSCVRDSGDPQWLKGPDDSTGHILSAECFRVADDTSLHLRQNGRGGWILTWLRGGTGETYASDEVSLIAHDPDPKHPRRLHYRRYWTPDDAMGTVIRAARFVGIDAASH